MSEFRYRRANADARIERTRMARHRRRNNAASSDPATPVHKRPHLDLSRTGAVYFSMILFMGAAAANTQANLLFGVLGLMVGVLLIAGVISRAVLRRLGVRRGLPGHAVVGKTVAPGYEVTKTKVFWPRFFV